MSNTLGSIDTTSKSFKDYMVSLTPAQRKEIMPVMSEEMMDYINEQESLAIEKAVEAKYNRRVEGINHTGCADAKQAFLQEDVEEIYKYNSGDVLKWTNATVYTYKEYVDDLLEGLPKWVHRYLDEDQIIEDQYNAGEIMVVAWNHDKIQWEEYVGNISSGDKFFFRIIRVD